MVDKNRPGYANGPPWVFKGSALYQLHLVKSDTARHFIPKEFKLVEAFGYTLGGFFLAHYDDSPAGMFDELVVLAGIVWNPPTSCAWAARVLVNSDEACLHGRKDVGLPSHVAGFTKRVAIEPQLQGNRGQSFLDRIGLGTSLRKTLEIEVKEIEGSCATAFCNIRLPNSVVETESTSYAKHLGPMVRMSLPSFSGHTEYKPHLLKYSCQLECRIRPVKAAKVSRVGIPQADDQDSHSNVSSFTLNDMDNNPLEERDELSRSISVLLSKPILALEFNSLRMNVEAPRIVSRRWKRAEVS